MSQITQTQTAQSLHRTIPALTGALLALLLAGCHSTPENNSAAPANSSSSTTARPASIKAPRPAENQSARQTGRLAAAKPIRPTSVKAPHPTPIKMTPSQKLGVDILQAFNASPALRGHSISVGTDATSVILNGQVHSAAQRQSAEQIARQHAKGFKVTNHLQIVKT